MSMPASLFSVRSFFITSATLFSMLILSCAPVKFSKQESFDVTPLDQDTISCDPKINGTLIKFTYAVGGALPNISTNCKQADAGLTYTYNVKRGDGSVVNTEIPGLTGANPNGVNFQPQGPGTYYVFLTASGSGKKPFVAITPLEFVVMNGNNPYPALTCNPRLNSTETSVTINPGGANPALAANCAINADNYIWQVKKGGVNVTIPSLTGASSTPDFKAAGAGTYSISLYATAAGYTAYNSPQPLTVTVVAPLDPILCSPRINGSLTSITLTASSAKPLISAGCNPSDVTYTWSVKKGSDNIMINDLSGANSNPDIYSRGVGTYYISLMASASGRTSWQSTSPLVVTVASAEPPQTVSCAPRLNDSLVNLNITTSGPNPKVTSNCSPAGASITWTLTRNGAGVSPAFVGLNGVSSVPSLTSLGVGTYAIQLSASYPGYNSYSSPSPLTVTITAAPATTRDVQYTKQVTYSDNKVDFLLVIDDSNSMLPDNQMLASRLEPFLGDLANSGVDWQMCLTLTRAQNITNVGWRFGASRLWSGYGGGFVLKPSAPNLSSVFMNTINAIGAGIVGSDDERPIKAAWAHFDNKDLNGCYRSDAALSMITISDEDERSIGGDKSQEAFIGEYQPLETDDLPQTLVNKVKSDFGAGKRFTANSIIIKPGDSACKQVQDSGGYVGHYGYKHAELSSLTSGATTSICSSDYTSNLNYFKDRIVSNLTALPLECTPVGNVTVTITPPLGSSVTSRIEGTNVVFSTPIPAGRTVQLNYKCPLTN